MIIYYKVLFIRNQSPCMLINPNYLPQLFPFLLNLHNQLASQQMKSVPNFITIDKNYFSP
jgi:hypothetical protein